MSTSTPNLETKIVQEIDEALEKLRPSFDEYNQLSEMRARVTGNTRTTRSRSSSSSSSNNSSSPRANRGTRLDQFVTLVSQRPGITIGEAAEEMAVQPNYLYRLRNQGVADNKIRVEDGKVYPAAAPAAAPA